MWNIARRTQFKKDYKRERKSSLDVGELEYVLNQICNREPLPEKYHDHKLVGSWKGRRECHMQPDVLLIYKGDEENQMIVLERLGSHSELFE